jgi:hypothetical protein
MSTSAHVTFLETEGPDVLLASPCTGGVTAYLWGDDDIAHGTEGDDLFFAGAGMDTVDAAFGDDVCVDTEVPTGCKSTTAP